MLICLKLKQTVILGSFGSTLLRNHHRNVNFLEVEVRDSPVLDFSSGAIRSFLTGRCLPLLNVNTSCRVDTFLYAPESMTWIQEHRKSTRGALCTLNTRVLKPTHGAHTMRSVQISMSHLEYTVSGSYDIWCTFITACYVATVYFCTLSVESWAAC